MEIEEQKPKMLFGGTPHRQPSWFVWALMKGARVLGFTLLWAGLGMAAGLFLGILFVMVASPFQHHAPDMSLAYREIAVPVAVLSGGAAFFWNLYGVLQAARQRHAAAR